MDKICIVKRRKGDLGVMAVPHVGVPNQSYPQAVTLELSSQQSEAIRSNSRFQQLYGGSSAPIFLNLHLETTLPFRMLKTDDVCEILQVSKHTVTRLAKAEAIRSHKIGRLRRFRPEDVMEYLSSHRGADTLGSFHTYALVSSDKK